MKVSTGRRGTLSWALVAAAMSLSLLAAACAPPVPPPSLPPGAIDISDASFLRWVKDEPVDVRLGVLGVGTGVVFELQQGTLPSGVVLEPDGRLVGVPEFSGTWFGEVIASGSSGSKSGFVFGYVVEEGPTGPAPTLEENPLRAPFQLYLSGDEGSTVTYPLYRPGSVTPEGTPVVYGSASEPPDPAEQPQPELNFQALFRTNRQLEVFDSQPSRCDAELRSIAGKLIRTIVLKPDQLCGETSHVWSLDGSTFVISASTASNGDGTTTRQHWFIRSSDGDVLRTASNTAPAESSVFLSQDGSLLGMAGQQLNELQVVGLSPEDDKTISFDDGTERVCQARPTYIGFTPTTGADRALLSCETPGGPYQAGTVDLRSGELWFSAPVPRTNPETGRFVFFFPLALSPAGDQIVVQWGEYEIVSIWPPQTRYFFEWGVIEVNGPDPTIRKMLDDPPDTRGFFLFQDE